MNQIKYSADDCAGKPKGSRTAHQTMQMCNNNSQFNSFSLSIEAAIFALLSFDVKSSFIELASNISFSVCFQIDQI